MSDFLRINETQVVIEKEIYTKGLGQVPRSSTFGDWLRKGGWTTVAGYATSAGALMMDLSVYYPKIHSGTMTPQDWVTVITTIGGPILMGHKAATSQKPQAEETKPAAPAASNAPGNFLGDVVKGPR